MEICLNSPGFAKNEVLFAGGCSMVFFLFYWPLGVVVLRWMWFARFTPRQIKACDIGCWIASLARGFGMKCFHRFVSFQRLLCYLRGSGLLLFCTYMVKRN